jgi:hypothetical protein
MQQTIRCRLTHVQYAQMLCACFNSQSPLRHNSQALSWAQ